MQTKTKYDRRRKYYMVLDCETATLPIAAEYDGNKRKKIAIAKPLIYDLGWQVIDRQGRVYSKKQFLISEIFSVPSIFNTAYYASKRPIYLDKLKKQEIILTNWNTAIKYLLEDIQHVEAVGAYNAMFDFKKALPFTDKYIQKLYSPDFYEWERKQNFVCKKIADGEKVKGYQNFDGDNFIFRDKKYPLFDLWGLSCEHLLNNDNYKRMCIDFGWETESGKYFKTSAETAYRFISNNTDFEESHTALEDVIIESELFAHIVKKKLSNLTLGIEYFPFRILGRVENFIY